MSRPSKWEEWQETFVRDHYPTMRSRDIGEIIGRTKCAVDHYASRNEIAKTPEAEFQHRSEARRGEGTPNFKGYRRKTSKGYYVRYVPWHPCASKDGLVMEHRLVMEGLIGRVLRNDEVVHHINGNKADNRPENLKLMSFSEHTSFHNSRRKNKCRNC